MEEAQEKQETELMNKAKETLAADNKTAPEESPLDKVERLNKDTKEMLDKITKERFDYEHARANDQISGKSILNTPPKTQEEQDKEEAKVLAKGLLG